MNITDLPVIVRLALDDLDLSKAHSQWLEFLDLNGGSDERWLVIAQAIFALRFHRQFETFPIEKCLEDYGIRRNHSLVALAHSTIALFDKNLFPNASFSVAGC